MRDERIDRRDEGVGGKIERGKEVRDEGICRRAEE